VSKVYGRLQGVDPDTADWFHSEKRRAQDRMDREDLSNDEFLELLLVVHNHHLNRVDHGDPVRPDHAD